MNQKKKLVLIKYLLSKDRKMNESNYSIQLKNAEQLNNPLHLIQR